MSDQRSPEAKTIWAVCSGQYSDYGVNAIFTTKEGAEEYARRCNFLSGNQRTWDRYEVEEFPLDPELPPDGKLSWTVYIHRNGDIQQVVQNTYNIHEQRVWDIQPCPRLPSGGWSVTGYAKDEDHAIKIAGEKRQEILANEAMTAPSSGTGEKT